MILNVISSSSLGISTFVGFSILTRTKGKGKDLGCQAANGLIVKTGQFKSEP